MQKPSTIALEISFIYLFTLFPLTLVTGPLKVNENEAGLSMSGMAEALMNQKITWQE
jgi:hypothetical protein